MKKIFVMMATAALVLAGCDKNPQEEDTQVFKFTKTAPTQESVPVAKAGGEVTISVEVNTALTSIDDIATSATEDWVTPGEPTIEGNVVSVVFTVTENDTYEGRTATLIVASEEGEDPQGSILVEVVQAQADKFSVTGDDYNAPAAGGNFAVTVDANVDYDAPSVSYGQTGGEWISVSNAGDVWTFTVDGLAVETSRSATIDFSADGFDTKTINVTQSFDGSISKAVYFGTLLTTPDGHVTRNRAWPDFNGDEDFKDMETFTMEALVKGDWHTKTPGGRSDKNMSMIMGREAMFLIRVGDAPAPSNEMQVCWNNDQDINNPGNPETWDLLTGPEGKFTFNGVPENEWFHVAVTYDYPNKECMVYINGVAQTNTWNGGVKKDASFAPIDLSLPHNNEPTGAYAERCFWLGFGNHGDRYLDGTLSEVRIWNDVRTPQEIAENFYYVDPASEGLLSYWKLNEGTGAVSKDYSSKGYDLSFQQAPEWKDETPVIE